MRFRTKQRPRGVLRAKDQRRLSLMVVGFGLILLCFTVARRPTFWGWMFPDEQNATQASEDSASGQSTYTPEQVLQHDEILISDNNSGQLRSSVDETSQIHETFRIPYGDSSSDAAIPQVGDHLLKTIKDDTIGIHSAESDAYFAAMKLASKIEQRRNLKAPRGKYALFMDSPVGSRGVAWKIEGQLRQLTKISSGPSGLGVGASQYEGWITTPDSGDQLLHVVAMNADKSLTKLIPPRSKNRTVKFSAKGSPDIRFTGYFFKREGYASGTEDNPTLSLAPLFVAGTIHNVPPKVVTTTRADQLTPYLGWLTVAICAGIAVMIWNFSTSDIAHSQTRAHQLTKLPAYASFDDISAVTVSEALGQLQNTEHQEVN